MDVNANVMSTAPTAADTAAQKAPAPKTNASSGKNGKPVAAKDEKNSGKTQDFNDALEKAKDDQQNTKEATVSTGNEFNAADPLTASLTAVMINQGEKILPSPEKSASSELAALPSESSAGKEGSLTVQPAAKQQVIQAEANAQLQLATLASAENITAAEADMAEKPQALPLEALLPQNEKSAAAGQQLIDLLGGKNVAAAMKAQTATTQQLVQQTTVMSQIANQNFAATAEQQPTNTVPVVQNMLMAETPVVQQNAAATPVPSSAKDMKPDKKANNFFDGLVVTVEDKTKPLAEPLSLRQESAQAQPESSLQPQSVTATAEKTVVSEQAGKEAVLPAIDASAIKTDHVSSLAQSSPGMAPTTAAQAVTDSGPAARPATDYEIPKQIIDQVRLIKTTEDTQMVIRLKPEHLGELVLKVSVAGGAVSTAFHSDNAEVRAIIENSIVQLKQEMQAQGLKVDNVGVYAGLGEFLSGGQSGQAQQQNARQFKHRNIDLADFEDDVAGITALGNDSGEDGIDYRI
ncbi:MAG: flagellar hook-length control protein FliK [Selenomonadaceae bacterium]